MPSESTALTLAAIAAGVGFLAIGIGRIYRWAKREEEAHLEDVREEESRVTEFRTHEQMRRAHARNPVTAHWSKDSGGKDAA